jgi:deoxyadenosine/deoxycytidine kinase
MSKIEKTRIGVVGPMGSGKTSLVKFLLRNWKIKLISENFNQNPFLEKYYKNPKLYSFASQVWFYENRISQIKNFNKFRKAVIDNDIEGNKVFALAQHKMGFMQDDEYLLYKRITNLMDNINNYEKTKLLIYTYASYKTILERVSERARKFELQKTEKEKKEFEKYIKVLCASFEEWYKKNKNKLNIYKVNSEELNYLTDKTVQNSIINDIEKFSKKRNIKIN